MTYRSAWPSLSGGVTARDVTLVPPVGAEGGKFHFASLSIEVPFFEYYRSGFSRERGSLLNSIRNLRLEFDDGHGDLNYSFTHELNLLGVVSAAPFEAEGCGQDTVWLESELGEMGLYTRGTQLVMAYHLEDGRLVKEQTLYTAGAGRVDFRREMIKHDNYSLFSLIESGRSEVAKDEWRVQDEGFVAARNRYCESKDKVDNNEFVQRHVASVKRLLETAGLAPQAELEAAYRGYANLGGNFDLAIQYDPPIGAPLYSASDMGSNWLPQLQGKFTVNGKSHPLTLAAVTPRPLPASEEILTTYELIQRENGTAADNPKKEAPAAHRTVSRNPPAQVASVSLATPASAVTAKKRPQSETTGASQPRVVEAASNMASPIERDGLDSYRQLANYVGQHLTIYQKGHEPVRVEILRVIGAGDIFVRRHVSGGDIEYVLDRKNFDHAEE